MEKNELQIKVENLLKKRKLTKVGLASTLGIPKQNLDRVFRVKNGDKLKVVADYVGIPLDELISNNAAEVENDKKHPDIDGFVEVDGVVYRVKSVEDLQRLLGVVISNI